MQGHAGVLTQLNAVLGETLMGINQYFLHARMCSHWGLHALGQHIYKQSICDMKRADALVERVFLLGGLPNLQSLGKLRVAQTLREVLACDLALEQERHATLVQAVAQCEQARDFVSRELLVRHKAANEDHMDWLRTQHEWLQSLGEPNYVQQQAA